MEAIVIVREEVVMTQKWLVCFYLRMLIPESHDQDGPKILRCIDTIRILSR